MMGSAGKTEDLKECDQLADIGVNGREMLKCSLNKRGEWIWI
jgi:hypothetical protein